MFTDSDFTGTPTAPTPAKATKTAQLASTEFVHNVVDDYSLLAQTVGTATRYEDNGNSKLYKIYMENDELILEDV